MPDNVQTTLHQLLYLLEESQLSAALERLTAKPDRTHTELIQLYRSALLLAERKLDEITSDDSLISTYQSTYRELESLIQQQGKDDRHHFVIIIPIADRPLHLEECLSSLLELCRTFEYGGKHNDRYRKVLAMVADDSKEPGNIARHRELCTRFTAQGLETDYFGLDEQITQLEQLPAVTYQRLGSIIGTCDKANFHHKGPSILRNIVYLKLNQMNADGNKRLFYFVDSDQQFRIRLSRHSGTAEPYLLNYLYQLDNHFSQLNISLLTGKVVGDPPVSPAVMAGTFLDDVIAFIEHLSSTQHNQQCSYHDQHTRHDSGAVYHDMAALFGFQNDTHPYSYQCPLLGAHTHSQCLTDFATRLNQFFDGVHPTRISYFNSEDNITETHAARTVYTGNYILRSTALRYFIPFAPLRLRMAGPSLGRLIQAELGTGFVAANLPLLHKRTTTQTGQSEYRPGVAHAAQRIDLSGEFERQFFGDIMLFGLEKLIAGGYPQAELCDVIIEQILTATLMEMQQRYTQMQTKILSKLDILNGFIDDEQWWKNFPDSLTARSDFRKFRGNMTHNFGFGAAGFLRIRDPHNQTDQLQRIQAAIKLYMQDRACWDNALAEQMGSKH